ncbi:MAG: hypothetical protein ACI4II_10105 [Acutalibacteraceae bacterium]
MRTRSKRRPQKTRTISFSSAQEHTNSYNRKYTTVKWIVYMAEIIIFCVIQGTPGLVPTIHGQKPILLIPVAITIALFCNERSGMVFAMICGLMLDTASSNILGFFAMLLLVFGFLEGYMSVNYIKISLMTAMIWVTLAVPIILYLHYFFFYKVSHYGANDDYFFTHYLPRMIYTWAVTPVFYFLNKLISKIGPKD